MFKQNRAYKKDTLCMVIFAITRRQFRKKETITW